MRPDKHGKAAPTGPPGWCEKVCLGKQSHFWGESEVPVLSPVEASAVLYILGICS